MRSGYSLSLILGIIEHLATCLFVRNLQKLRVFENSAALSGLTAIDHRIETY